MAKQLRIALAGNANVGKSAIFNQLTGLNQITGNWPGKTVERAEGTLRFGEYKIRIIDLPGIYSLTTFSMEEVVSRDYIAIEKPDVIINVIDASALERNLYFTLQLLELEAPIVIDLNQVDLAAKKGFKIDEEKVASILGVPVVSTVAVTGSGVNELLSKAIAVADSEIKPQPVKIKYGKEVEKRIESVAEVVNLKTPQICEVYPTRWIASKLLERDSDIAGKLRSHQNGKEVLDLAEKLANDLESIHGEPSPVIMASERYAFAAKIAKDVTAIETPPKISLNQRLDSLTTHKILGYPILISILASIFVVIFLGGNYVSVSLEHVLGIVSTSIEDALLPMLPPTAVDLVSKGVISGITAGITIALPYIVPFYILLALLEDSGYLPRAAFLMDSLMHKIGLHGKAFIPLILGYGCSVPACMGCRIMETGRERLIAAFVAILIPCAARTVVILGLVGRFVGLHAALALYAFDLGLVLVLGRIAFKILPGEPVGLIMEMPQYRRPSLRTIATKTWSRTKDFVHVAFPIIIVGSVAIQILFISGTMSYATSAASPLMSGWLGLPDQAIVPLVFGILRKELALIMFAETVQLASLTYVQMIVFSLVIMLYIPCLATMAACKKEFGWKKALTIAGIDVVLALVLGGIAYRFLSSIMTA